MFLTLKLPRDPKDQTRGVISHAQSSNKIACASMETPRRQIEPLVLTGPEPRWSDRRPTVSARLPPRRLLPCFGGMTYYTRMAQNDCLDEYGDTGPALRIWPKSP